MKLGWALSPYHECGPLRSDELRRPEHNTMSDPGWSRRTLAKLAARDGWECNGCGEMTVPWAADLARDVKYATVDHKDPKGGNGQDNLWVMCAYCNASKGHRTLEEWEKSLDFDGGWMRKGFTMVPNTLLENSNLTMGARMTLMCLMSFAWRGNPFPGQERLGKMLGCTDRTAREYLCELRDAGFLKVQRRGRGKTNVYRIVHAKVTALPAESTGLVVDDRNPASALDRNPASAKEYEVKENEVTPIAAAPRARQRDLIWDTLEEIFGPAQTRTEQSLRGKAVSSLRMAKATPEEILRRAKAWPLHFGDVTLTQEALEKHYTTLGRKPLRRR